MILAILQARTSSTRLPGKVLKPILGRPMLARHLERLARARRLDRLVVATSTEPGDNPIADLCRAGGVECFRGSLGDVLDRFYRAALACRPDTIVRLTGDCPLADPQVIDSAIRLHAENDYDYVTNTVERTYPIGLDVEVFDFRCLEEAWREAILPSEREHVTPFIRNHPERYRIGQLKGARDLSHHRWTVDEPADFEFVENVYKALYPENPAFDTDDILDLLERQPQLTAINYHIVHGEGFQKSLRQDVLFLAASEDLTVTSQ